MPCAFSALGTAALPSSSKAHHPSPAIVRGFFVLDHEKSSGTRGDGASGGLVNYFTTLNSVSMSSQPLIASARRNCALSPWSNG